MKLTDAITELEDELAFAEKEELWDVVEFLEGIIARLTRVTQLGEKPCT